MEEQMRFAIRACPPGAFGEGGAEEGRWQDGRRRSRDEDRCVEQLSASSCQLSGEKTRRKAGFLAIV